MRSRNREWNGGRPGERRTGGSRWKRILLVVVLVIVIVAAVLVASWRVLDAMGRSSLYSAQEHAVPTLGSQDGGGGRPVRMVPRAALRMLRAPVPGKTGRKAGCGTRGRFISITAGF